MLAVLLGLFAALSWSLHDLLARALAQRVGPFRLAAWVMIAGGILLAGYILPVAGLPMPSRQGLFLSLGLGLAYGFGAGGLCKAFSLGPISLVAPVTATYPVLVLLWGLFRGLQPSALQWGAAATALLGAVVVASASTESSNMALPKGVLGRLLFFCLLSGVGYASAIILGQYASVLIGETEAAFISRPAATIILLPFIFSETRPATLRPVHWLGILAMGGLDVLGLVAVNATGHLANREFAAVGISAYGAIAVLLAMAVLKEKVVPLQWMGIGMVVAGVATLSVSQ